MRTGARLHGSEARSCHGPQALRKSSRDCVACVVTGDEAPEPHRSLSRIGAHRSVDRTGEASRIAGFEAEQQLAANVAELLECRLPRTHDRTTKRAVLEQLHRVDAHRAV